MRYIKALLLIAVFFFGMIFLFQNQIPLSQKLTLRFDLLVLPPMESIEIPFYMLILFAFLVGAVMSLLLLLWDRVHITARAMRAEWKADALENSERRLIAEMEKMAAAPAEERASMFAKIKADFLSRMEERRKKKEAKNAAKEAEAAKKAKIAKAAKAAKEAKIAEAKAAKEAKIAEAKAAKEAKEQEKAAPGAEAK